MLRVFRFKTRETFNSMVRSMGRCYPSYSNAVFPVYIDFTIEKLEGHRDYEELV